MSDGIQGREPGEPRRDPGEPAPDALEEFRERRDRVRRDMGGAHAVERIHHAGGLTVRDRLEAFLDPGTFREVGTFSESLRAEDRGKTPGDGKVGGHGLVGGRPVTVAGDDITVKRGSSSVIGSRKLHRLLEQALAAGNPMVYFGETGGARIPDAMGAEGHTTLSPFPDFGRRMRRIPLATAIVGPSFGGSSLLSAISDFVVQVRGSCLSITSPRVVEIATGEGVTMEDLGGVDVHLRKTGQIDAAADTEDEAFDLVRRFLSYLPQSAWSAAPRDGGGTPLEPDPELAEIVPRRRQRAYDMKAVIARVVDGGDFLELKPSFGRSLLTALARIDGYPVGVIASQPLFQAGAIGPDACDKAVRLLILCDAFNLPVVFLHDTPGFLVGKQVEHDRLLQKAMRLQQALCLSTTPKLSVVVRKSFGLAHQLLNGARMDADALLVWPTAEIGFMDPQVGANIVYWPELQALPEEERTAALLARAAEIAEGTDAYAAAGPLNVDEIIDPADTRAALAHRLRQIEGRRVPPPEQRVLAAWPSS